MLQFFKACFFEKKKKKRYLSKGLIEEKGQAMGQRDIWEESTPVQESKCNVSMVAGPQEGPQ